MVPATIDEVVSRLDDILKSSVADGDRRGYFAALYNRVTQRVRAGIQAGEFDDNPRMERFDVVFANRYFDAYDAWAAGGAPTPPWAKTIAATQGSGLLVLQYLLLAMITHITFDLGIVVATVAPGPSLPSLRADFMRINQLLSEETGTVEDELVEIAGAWCPDAGRILEVCEECALGVERTAARRIMDTARDYAWEMATRLATATPGERDAILVEYEKRTADLLDLVLLPSPHERDSTRSIADDIKILAQGELSL